MEPLQEGIQHFFQIVLTLQFVIQEVATAVAGVIVLNHGLFPDPRQKWKVLWPQFLIHVFLLSAALIGFQGFFFVVAHIFQVLRGINYSLPVLCVYLIYALFLKKTVRLDDFVLISMMFATVVTMMEWSASYSIPWEEGLLSYSQIMLIADCLIIFIACFMRAFSTQDYGFTRSEATLSIIVAAITAFCAMYHEYSIDWTIDLAENVRTYIFINFILMYLINLITYIGCYAMSRNRKELLLLEVMDQKKEAELEMSRLTQAQLQELREIRHDIKNQYFYMLHMLEEGKYEALKDYFEKFTGKFSSQLFSYFDCGNNDISSVINLERIKAERQNITLNMNIVAAPELPIDSADLCSLLMNLLDNAIEACDEVKTDRSIHVIINMPQKNSLYICVINPTLFQSLPAFHSLPTHKADKQLHGLGMGIITHIAEKYDGTFQCHVEDSKFTAEVLMNFV